MKPLNRHQAKRAWKTFNLCIGPMRKRARELGYALAVHGSLARDIDIIAIPWTDTAASADELAMAIFAVIYAEHERIDAFGVGCIGWKDPVDKPHGRRVWEIHVWGSYFDFGVMPRLTAGSALT